MKSPSMKSFFRTVFLTIVVTGAQLLNAQDVRAQGFPSKPLRVVVPWPSGGLVDVAARQLVNRMQTGLGQRMIVDNKLGAGGNLGADLVAKAPADGYTLLFTSSALTISSALGAKMNFDAVKDLERVALVAHAPSVLVVSQDSRIQSLQELVKLARSQPGKLSYASSGVGSPAHLTSELFKSRAGLYILHIPYTGAPAAMIDQIAGRIDFQFTNASVALPQIKAGKVRALAVTSAQRLAGLPQVPTMAEAGMANFETDQWLGLLAPKGTPAAVISSLAAEANKVLVSEEFAAALNNAGMSVARSGTPERFDAFFRKELAQWARLVATAGIKPE